jgi:regulator of RNase E activity RraA
VASVNTSITIPTAAGFNVIVNPEDVIVADWDGVVAIPPELVEQALEVMKVSVEQDRRCMEDLVDGRGVEDTFKKHRSH